MRPEEFEAKQFTQPFQSHYPITKFTQSWVGGMWRERGWGNWEGENWRFVYPLFQNLSLFYSFPCYASFKFHLAFFLLSAYLKEKCVPSCLSSFMCSYWQANTQS